MTFLRHVIACSNPTFIAEILNKLFDLIWYVLNEEFITAQNYYSEPKSTNTLQIQRLSSSIQHEEGKKNPAPKIHKDFPGRNIKKFAISTLTTKH